MRAAISSSQQLIDRRDMDETLRWETFRDFFVERGRPKALRIPGKTPAVLFVSEHGERMGLRLPLRGVPPSISSPLRQISVKLIGNAAKRSLELSTTTPSLFKEFFLFSIDVVDAVQRNGVAVDEAVQTALRAWTRLLQRAARLSRDDEVGLLGELLLLETLFEGHGKRALDAWTGPRREPHDFRIGASEFEVKTTTTVTRTHMINGWYQLRPSKGMALYLVSIQVEPAGGAEGRALPEVVEALRVRSGALRPVFDNLLTRARYDDQDAPQYDERFRKRGANLLVPIDESCPRLTPDLVSLPTALAARLSDVHYRVNVEGLGFAEGSRQYKAQLAARSST